MIFGVSWPISTEKKFFFEKKISKKKVKFFFLNLEKIRMSVGPIFILHRVPNMPFGGFLRGACPPLTLGVGGGMPRQENVPILVATFFGQNLSQSIWADLCQRRRVSGSNFRIVLIGTMRFFFLYPPCSENSFSRFFNPKLF